jgi:hypothetical protein
MGSTSWSPTALLASLVCTSFELTAQPEVPQDRSLLPPWFRRLAPWTAPKYPRRLPGSHAAIVSSPRRHHFPRPHRQPAKLLPLPHRRPPQTAPPQRISTLSTRKPRPCPSNDLTLKRLGRIRYGTPPLIPLQFLLTVNYRYPPLLPFPKTPSLRGLLSLLILLSKAEHDYNLSVVNIE